MMTPFSQVCFFLLLLYSKEHINYRIILLQQHSTKRENSYTVLRSSIGEIGLGSLAHKWQFGKKRAKWTTHGVSKSQKRFRSTLKVPKKGQFWQVFENLKFAVKQCYQTGHIWLDINSNATFWVIFKHCAYDVTLGKNLTGDNLACKVSIRLFRNRKFVTPVPFHTPNIWDKTYAILNSKRLRKTCRLCADGNQHITEAH